MISQRWIVSAAHCTQGYASYQIFIVLGTISRTTGGTRYNVLNIVDHPDYDNPPRNNDISLLQTIENVAFTRTIAPAELEASTVGGGVFVVASGWGLTHPDQVPEILQFLYLTTLTNNDCRSMFNNDLAGLVRENNICTFIGLDKG